MMVIKEEGNYESKSDYHLQEEVIYNILKGLINYYCKQWNQAYTQIEMFGKILYKFQTIKDADDEEILAVMQEL